MAAEPSFKTSLLSGAMAGIMVDVSMFPIDTIKTRMQSPDGFIKAGGFRGVYNGVLVASLGAAPGSAFFFTAYDFSKHYLSQHISFEPATHMLGAAIGEAAACVVRVPTENVKQKQQAGLHGSMRETIRAITRANGLRGFYVGYGTTVAREIPFSFLQFPIWEKMKKAWAEHKGAPLAPWQGALCGSLSGAFAAAVTTPLDVAKTRLMIDQKNKYSGMVGTLRKIAAEEGWRALFLGITPRVMWISIGGFVFFGAYEATKEQLNARDASW